MDAEIDETTQLLQDAIDSDAWRRPSKPTGEGKEQEQEREENPRTSVAYAESRASFLQKHIDRVMQAMEEAKAEIS